MSPTLPSANCQCLDTSHQTLISVLSVVKNPLSPAEHPGGVGVNNELFEESLEQFVVCLLPSFTRDLKRI